MKKTVLFLIVMLLTINVMAQINANPNPNGPVWITGDSKSVEEDYFRSIPYLHLSDTSLNTQLPLRVQNDTSKYFPPIFAQGNVCCCTFASEVGYVFTYEMNRIRDVSAGLGWYLRQGVDTSDMHNLYHPLYGYNFKNHGYYKQFTYQADGFKLLQSVGCPMLNYYYNNCLQPSFSDSIKAMYWMSSYDGYADAIRQKVDNIYQIRFNPYNYSTFDTLKHWLYDHNEGEGSVGGLASIAILTGGSDWAQLPNNEWIYTQLGNDNTTGHVVTIVGYDDEICYDLNENNHIDQDEYGAFKVANSWGTWLGTGYIWLPYKLMRDLQNHRRMAFCCTVKECEPTVYVKGTWVHPHEYAKRNRFYPVLGTRIQSDMSMDYYQGIDYPIFHLQGGSNTLQGINNADSICIGFDFSYLFPDLDNAGKYFIRMHNTSNTTGNKIKNLSIVDYRWNEIFEIPYDGMEVSIDDSYTIIGLKYELLPFESPITTSNTYNRELVTRRTVNLEGNSTTTLGSQTLISMYGTNLFDSEIIVGENATLQLADNVRIIAKRGDCRIIVKGTMTIGQNVTFEARDGATLEIVFEDDADLVVSNIHFINCNLVFPQKDIRLSHCEFKGTPLDIRYLSPEITGQQDTVVIADCNFDPNGQSIQNALYIKDCSCYSITGCNVSDTCCGGTFVNGILLQGCGMVNGMAMVRNNDIMDCTGTGLLMYNSRGDITMNRIHDNGYGVKLLNNCNIGQFSGRCEVEDEELTQYIVDNTYNEVFMTGSSIPQTFRYNAIHDDDNVPFIYHDGRDDFNIQGDTISRSPIDVTYNYWGTNFVPSTHLYTNLTLGYSYYPTWAMGSCENNGVIDEMLLRQADSLYNAGVYASAKILYERVVEDYLTTVSAETALKTLLELEYHVDNDFESLQEYYLSEETIQADETLTHLASSLANKCDEIMENYSNAISWYEEVLTDPNTNFNDSIFAAIDLGDLYLKMEAGGEKTVGKWVQYKPESEKAYRNQTNYALSLMPKEKCNNYFHSDLWPVTVFETMDTRDGQKDDGINISPNPTTGFVTITGKNLKSAEVLNMFGQCVAKVQGQGETLQVDIAKLPAGVYFVNIMDEEGRKCVRKVVKE